jgi:hypothetical protein
MREMAPARSVPAGRASTRATRDPPRRTISAGPSWKPRSATAPRAMLPPPGISRRRFARSSSEARCSSRARTRTLRSRSRSVNSVAAAPRTLAWTAWAASAMVSPWRARRSRSKRMEISGVPWRRSSSTPATPGQGRSVARTSEATSVQEAEVEAPDLHLHGGVHREEAGTVHPDLHPGDVGDPLGELGGQAVLVPAQGVQPHQEGGGVALELPGATQGPGPAPDAHVGEDLHHLVRGSQDHPLRLAGPTPPSAPGWFRGRPPSPPPAPPGRAPAPGRRRCGG